MQTDLVDLVVKAALEMIGSTSKLALEALEVVGGGGW
jgi:hypothetical protein